MAKPLARLAVLCVTFVALLAPRATAGITRATGPTTVVTDSRALVKFDAAYDSVNRVYLVAYGTQASGPVNGMLISESGTALTGLFALSDGPVQSGWARVIYSPEQGRFLVSYVKIVGNSHHQKAARFVTVSNNVAAPGPEMILDDWIGNAGTATGMAYAKSGKFLVTWSHYLGSFPATFVSIVDPSGGFSAPITVSFGGDGESDPEIACDGNSRKCLIVGIAWGVLDGSGKSSYWGRFIDDATGAPEGGGYIFRVGGLMDPPAVVSTASKLLIGLGVGGVIKGMIADGSSSTFGLPFTMMQDLTGTQGVGYGFLSMRANPASQAVIATTTSWIGWAAVQEFTPDGLAAPNGFDLIPDTPEVASKPWDSANQFTVPAVNTRTGGYAVFEDHYFKSIRVTTYTTGTITLPATPKAAPVRNDIDGDRKADPILWNALTGVWSWQNSSTTSAGQSSTMSGIQFGNAALGDRALSGDLDGDGIADLITWRASTGTWFWLLSSTGYDANQPGQKQWGNINLGDWPLVADMDGDRRSDLVIWRSTTGTWFWLTSSTNYSYASAGVKQWGDGQWGDIPLLGDFDGDGKADLTVWRSYNGSFYWLTSSTAYNWAYANLRQWGNSTLQDQPMLADLDGDGKVELVVWRPGTGTWFWLTSASLYGTADQVQWGSQYYGDIPLLMDFDGDGRSDIAVWRASSATWYWLPSSKNFDKALYGIRFFGVTGDMPIR